MRPNSSMGDQEQRNQDGDAVHRFESQSGSFYVELMMLGPGLIHMKKSGYQSQDDVQGETDLVMKFLAEYCDDQTAYLCIDASDFRGLSRQARKIQERQIEEMPFAVVAAYGLSFAMRVLAMVFATHASKRSIRLFADRASALAFIDGHRSGLNPLVKEESWDVSVRVQQRIAQIMEDEPAYVGRMTHGDETYRTFSHPDWCYADPEIPFYSTQTLISSDTILTESRGLLTTESIVKATTENNRAVFAQIGADYLYFIHDSRAVTKVTRRARVALKHAFSENPVPAFLSVIVGKPVHVVMMKWLRLFAPTVFQDWVVSSSVEEALEIIAEHRRERLDSKPVTDIEVSNHAPTVISPAADGWIPDDRDELVALVKAQRAALDEQEVALNQIFDGLGRLTWDSGHSSNKEEREFGPNFDLVFGALELAESDFKEIVDELNLRMDELTQSRKQLWMAQKIAHLGSWEWDVATGDLTWSDETFRIYGYEPGSVEVNYPLFIKHQHPDTRDEIVSAIKQTMESSTPFENTQRIIHTDGSERIVSARGSLERNEAGEPIRMYGTCHDITDVVRAQEAERKAHEEMRARESALRETLLDLSHDVRTPLASLKVGLGRFDVTERSTTLKSALVAEVEYVDGLFANLVSLLQYKGSSIQLNMHETRANEVLERVAIRLELFATERNISFETSDSAETLMLNADPLALEQAIGNLVHNAIKFADGNVALLLHAQGAEVVFEVCDDGPGITDMEIPKITERHYRGIAGQSTPGRGMGLGLPIARAIIEDHHGTLCIEHMERKGTRILVRLPLRD